jgi:hypothetical protein
MEFIVGTVIALLTFFIGRWDGKRSERAITSAVAQVPVRTASIVESVFTPLMDDAYSNESGRGWDLEYRATVGWADVTGRDRRPRDLLIEYPVGAHSAALIVFEENLELNQVRILGQLHNGVGFSFHVGDFTGQGHTEIGTVNYIQDLPLDRPLFDAPIQAVYYRWDGAQFAEVGRGPVYDPREEPEPPPSVRRFMGKSWNVDVSDPDADDVD